MNGLMEDPTTAQDPTLLNIAAMIYNKEGRHEDALKCVHTASSLEMMSTLVHTYLLMDRVDLAEKPSTPTKTTALTATRSRRPS